MQGIFKTVLATIHLRGRLTSTAASLQPDPAYYQNKILYIKYLANI